MLRVTFGLLVALLFWFMLLAQSGQEIFYLFIYGVMGIAFCIQFGRARVRSWRERQGSSSISLSTIATVSAFVAGFASLIVLTATQL